ncbi:recombinase [Halomonas cupida]|uniref:Recombinase n=1 Tax=Halomonas cupida TaxID=44933 RepID=A0A1M7KGB6_9GAMM|nr:site-specific integrase [Halomonas cupida]GEN25426.1 recombinase [Halomonas cupida]SHM63897.1 Site-specific recombinase XerC [Halomonas cupida]
MSKTTEKLTTRALERLSRELPNGDEVWDSELSGYHIRAGQRGLALRLSYYNSKRQRRVLTLGRYGELTAAQAREIARDAVALIARGEDPRSMQEREVAHAEHQRQQTLRAYLEQDYADHQRRRKDGKSTLRRIEGAFSEWMDRPMSNLSRSDVEQWQSNAETAPADDDDDFKPPSFATLKRSYGALQTLLNHAAQRGVIPENPIKGVRLHKPALTSEDLESDEGRRYLEASEVDAFFAGLDAYQEEKRSQRRKSRVHGKGYLPDLDAVTYVDHAVPWLQTMYYTGFRPGDLFGLRWSHLNLEVGTIRKIIEKTAHQKPEPQTFPISDAATLVLKTWWEQKGKPGDGFVFPSPVTGRRMASTAMRVPWDRVCKLGGMSAGLVLYTLRHNFASQLVMAGVDLLTVSKLMGHSDIQTTIKYYAHLQPDHKRNAVQLFARIGQGTRLRESGQASLERTDASAVLE